MEPQRFHLIDGLRGIAALSVVLFHANAGGHVDSLPDWLKLAFSRGDLGVAIFFVLSGFVIAHSLRNEPASLVSTGRFMLRRSIRLDPPYWASIALTLGFTALAAYVMSGRERIEVTPGQIIAHLFYVQDILGFQQINPIFWTLCLEIQFYLVYSIIRGSIVALALVFIGSLWWVVFPTPSPWFYPLFHCFLLGVGAYEAWKRENLRLPFLTFAGIVLIAGPAFSAVSAATAMLILCMAITGNIGAANWRPLQFLGLISYSLYLIHNPITGAAFNVGYRLTGRSVALEALWLVAVVGICLAAAYTMWWLIERPSMNVSRHVFRR